MSNAEVYCLNPTNRQIRGELTLDDGAYEFQIPAEVGAELVLWYTVGTQESPNIAFTVQAPKK